MAIHQTRRRNRMARLFLTTGLALAIVVPSHAEPKKDRFGDPLPEGAIARLGTLNFRPAHSLWHSLRVAVSPDGKTLAVGEHWGVRLFAMDTGKETGFIRVLSGG